MRQRQSGRQPCLIRLKCERGPFRESDAVVLRDRHRQLGLDVGRDVIGGVILENRRYGDLLFLRRKAMAGRRLDLPQQICTDVQSAQTQISVSSGDHAFGSRLVGFRLAVHAVRDLHKTKSLPVLLAVGIVHGIVYRQSECRRSQSLPRAIGPFAQIDVVRPLLDGDLRRGPGASIRHIVRTIGIHQTIAVARRIAGIEHPFRELRGIGDLHGMAVQGLLPVVRGEVAVVLDQPSSDADGERAGIVILGRKMVPGVRGLIRLSVDIRVLIRGDGHGLFAGGQRNLDGLAIRVADRRLGRADDAQPRTGAVLHSVGVRPRTGIVQGVAVRAQVGNTVTDHVGNDIAHIRSVVGGVLAGVLAFVALFGQTILAIGKHLLVRHVLDGGLAKPRQRSQGGPVHQFGTGHKRSDIPVIRFRGHDHRLGGTRDICGFPVFDGFVPCRVILGVDYQIDSGTLFGVQRYRARFRTIADHLFAVRLRQNRIHRGIVRDDVVREFAHGTGVGLVRGAESRLPGTGDVPSESEIA